MIPFDLRLRVEGKFFYCFCPKYKISSRVNVERDPLIYLITFFPFNFILLLLIA